MYEVVILEKEIRVGGRIDTLFFESQQTPKLRGEGKKTISINLKYLSYLYCIYHVHLDSVAKPARHLVMQMQIFQCLQTV